MVVLAELARCLNAVGLEATENDWFGSLEMCSDL